MNNIFQSAYFGKPYRTRDGRMARFVINMGEHYGHPYRLVIEGEDNFFNYDEHGMMADIERGFDIISEWQEEISEEELDRLAEEYYPYEYTSSLCASEEADYKSELREALKVGFRKALEYINNNKK